MKVLVPHYVAIILSMIGMWGVEITANGIHTLLPEASHLKCDLLKMMTAWAILFRTNLRLGGNFPHFYDKIVQLGGSIFPLPLCLSRWHLAGPGDPVQALQPSWIFWTGHSTQFNFLQKTKNVSLPDSSRRHWMERKWWKNDEMLSIWYDTTVCHKYLIMEDSMLKTGAFGSEPSSDCCAVIFL